MYLETAIQFLSVFLYLWPVWGIAAISLAVAQYTKSPFLKKLSNSVSLVLVCTIFFLRLLLFIRYPLQEYEQTADFNVVGEHDIVVMHKDGTLGLQAGSSEHVSIDSFDLKGLKTLSVSDIDLEEDGVKVNRRVLLYQGIASVPIVAKVNSRVLVKIPSAFHKKIDIFTQEDNVTVDLSRITAPEVELNVTNSTVSLYLPSGERAQKVTINGKDSSIKIYMQKGTTVNLYNGLYSPSFKSDLFVSQDDHFYHYRHQGSSPDEISLRVKVNLRFLEFFSISEHN